MSDLQKYISKRKAVNSDFRENYEDGESVRNLTIMSKTFLLVQNIAIRADAPEEVIE